MLALLLLLQVAGPPDAQKPLVRQPRCAPTEDDEVVVCARPGESLYRLKPLPPRPGDPPRDPLSFRLPGGGEGRAYVFENRVSDVAGRGIAVKAKFPLGRKPKVR